jgi:hypothetical protein
MSLPPSTLFSATRWLIIALMALMILGVLLCLFIGGALSFAWADIAPLIAKEEPGIDVAAIRHLLPGLVLGGAMILAVAVWGLRKLLALINSVRTGDPFTSENVDRLRQLGWIMVAVEVVALPFHWMAEEIHEAAPSLDMDAGISLNSILAILLVFVLARVFERGVEMRNDLEGTV